MKKTFPFSKKTIVGFLLAGASFYLQPSVIYAQDRKNTEQTSNIVLPKLSIQSSMGNFYANPVGLHLKKDYLLKNLNQWLGADPHHTFKLIKEDTDTLGIKHSVYQHYYKNIKVMDEFIIFHENNGYLTYINGEFTANINTQIGNPLNEDNIKSIISKDLGSNDIKFSDFETVITKVDNERVVNTYYSSKIGALSVKSLKAFTYYIDNSNSKVLKKNSKVYHTDTPSVSSTLNKGNQQITVDSYNNAYRLKDNARKVHTRDATNLDGGYDPVADLLTGSAEYINTTASFMTNATKPPVEVHWGMEKSFDYYLLRHNRNSYDGNGAPITNYYNVNFNLFGDDPSLPPNGTNAAAIDEGGVVFMAFGNGELGGNPSMKPLVNLDIAGHEYSHLVIGRNGLGGLNYEKESGALNESIADIMGTAIEFYSGINPNWTLGEGLMPSYSPSYLRNMADPNSSNSQNPKQPDTYHGTYWANTNVVPDSSNDYGGVHINSGVGNFWFYLLSEGGSGTNDIGNAYNVNGIGIQKAEKVIYRALMNYLTPNSTYIDAYNATRQAAVDLYGFNSNELIQNINAWYAVGIGSGQLATDETKLSENKLKVYPNPVSQGYFNIDSKLTRNSTYELYDISGGLLIPSQKLELGINKVSVHSFSTGIYLLKITQDGDTITKKIMVK